MLFILLISSLLRSTCCLRSWSSYRTRYTILSFVVVLPSLLSAPNYSHTKLVRLVNWLSNWVFSRWTSSNSGSIFFIVVVWCEWCSYLRQLTQHSCELDCAHSLSRQMALTISPLWLSLRVQQNIDIIKWRYSAKISLKDQSSPASETSTIPK